MEESRPDRARFAAKLRRLRELNGKMTQEQLASRSGVDVDLIRNYEQEKSLAKEDTLARLAAALGASPASLAACSLDSMLELDEKAQVRLAAQLLFQIAGSYDLEPCLEDGVTGVRGNGGYIEYALAEWMTLVEADAVDTAAALSDGIKPESYRQVQDQMVTTFAHLNRFELGFQGGSAAFGCPTPPPTLGQILKRLRKAQGLTQGGLAKTAGVSAVAIRAYEQGKRTPNDEQRTVIAKALGVPQEVLSDFGITDSNAAFHYLMELAHIYGLRPKRAGDLVVLAHVGRKTSLNKLFRDWRFAWIELQESGDQKAYRGWIDHYEGR